MKELFESLAPHIPTILAITATALSIFTAWSTHKRDDKKVDSDIKKNNAEIETKQSEIMLKMLQMFTDSATELVAPLNIRINEQDDTIKKLERRLNSILVLIAQSIEERKKMLSSNPECAICVQSDNALMEKIDLVLKNGDSKKEK